MSSRMRSIMIRLGVIVAVTAMVLTGLPALAWADLAEGGPNKPTTPTSTSTNVHSVAMAGGYVITAAIKADGRLFTREFSTPNTWGPFVKHGANDWVSVDVDLNDAGDAVLIAMKEGGALWTRHSDAPNVWGEWTRHGFDNWSTDTAPAVSMSSDGTNSSTSHVAISAVKADGRMYVREWTAASQAWGGWQRMGARDWVHTDIVVSEGAVRDVWVVGTKGSGRLYTRTKALTGEWAAWVNHGEPTWATDTPASLDARTSALVVLAGLRSNGGLETRTATNGAWGPFNVHPEADWASAEVGVDQTGLIALLATNDSGTMQLRLGQGDTWASWGTIGDSDWATEQPSIASERNRLSIMGVRQDGALLTQNWDTQNGFQPSYRHGFNTWAVPLAPTAPSPLDCVEEALSEISVAECKVLVAFWTATGGPSWTLAPNWDAGSLDPCTWEGLYCGDDLFVYLDNSNLQGNIPTELAQLDRLSALQLSRNSLTGQIPPELGQLENLWTLDLSRNQLSGEIPVELGELTSLRALSISNNQLTGAVPEQIGLLPKLTHLDLANNGLTGPLPPTLAGFMKLISLSNNSITGPIPAQWASSLADKSRLFLNNNRLTGAVPDFDQGRLRPREILTINLADNLLTELPATLISAQQTLDLSNNQFANTNIPAFDTRDLADLSGNPLVAVWANPARSSRIDFGGTCVDDSSKQNTVRLSPYYPGWDCQQPPIHHWLYNAKAYVAVGMEFVVLSGSCRADLEAAGVTFSITQVEQRDAQVADQTAPCDYYAQLITNSLWAQPAA